MIDTGVALFLIVAWGPPAAVAAVGAYVLAEGVQRRRTVEALGGVVLVGLTAAWGGQVMAFVQGTITAITAAVGVVAGAVVLAHSIGRRDWSEAAAGGGVVGAAVILSLEPVFDGWWTPGNMAVGTVGSAIGWALAGVLLFTVGMARLGPRPWASRSGRGCFGAAASAAFGFGMLVVTPGAFAAVANLG